MGNLWIFPLHAHYFCSLLILHSIINCSLLFVVDLFQVKSARLIARLFYFVWGCCRLLPYFIDAAMHCFKAVQRCIHTECDDWMFCMLRAAMAFSLQEPSEDVRPIKTNILELYIKLMLDLCTSEFCVLVRKYIRRTHNKADSSQRPHTHGVDIFWRRSITNKSNRFNWEIPETEVIGHRSQTLLCSRLALIRIVNILDLSQLACFECGC